MSLTHYWLDVELLVKEFSDQKRHDSNLDKIITCLEKMIPEGKELESLSTNIFKLFQLKKVAENLNKISQEIGPEGVPDVTSDSTRNFAVKYLTLLENFVAYTHDTTPVIKKHVDWLIMTAQQQALTLRSRINDYDQHHLT